MSRPTNIPGLLWKLVRLYPAATLAVGLGGVVFLAMLMPSRGLVPEACPLEQSWYDGDIHFNATLVFKADETGHYSTGGFASDAPQTHYHFRWTREKESVVVETKGAQTSMHYEIGRWEETNTCWLQFREYGEKPPPRQWGYRLFTDNKGWGRSNNLGAVVKP